MLGRVGADGTGCYRSLPSVAKYWPRAAYSKGFGIVITYSIVAVSVLGTAFVAVGLFLIVKGLMSRAEITAALMYENATTPSGVVPAVAGGAPDASETPLFEPSGPVEPIASAKTARERVAEITQRTVGSVGTFQQIPEGPQRQWFLNGLTIRTALNVAIMGYGVANLAIAAGTALLLAGVAAIAVGVPLIVAVSP